MVTAEEFRAMYDAIIYKHPEEIAKEYGIPSESASLILPSVTIYKRIIEEFRSRGDLSAGHLIKRWNRL